MGDVGDDRQSESHVEGGEEAPEAPEVMVMPETQFSYLHGANFIHNVQILTAPMDAVMTLEIVGMPGTVVYDMRGFADPQAFSLRSHDGRHPEILRIMVAHRDFQLFAKAMQGSAMCSLDCNTSVQVVLFCKAGKHRCVAGAEIMAQVCRTQGADVTVVHSKLEKGFACRCVQCNDQDYRRATLDEAVAMWTQAIG